jgi:hypothetical protein
MAGDEVGGRWGRAGPRIQESGFRSQNEEHLPSAFCLLLTADCLLYLAKRKNSNSKK